MELREELLRGIYAYGFEKPSAIQQVSLLALLPSPRVRESRKRERYQTEAMNSCPSVVAAVAHFFCCLCIGVVEIRTRTTLWGQTPRVAGEVQPSFSFETALGRTGVWSWSSSELGKGPAVLEPLRVLKWARLCVRTAFVSGVLRKFLIFKRDYLRICDSLMAQATLYERREAG